jgi:hypothetical protein
VALGVEQDVAGFDIAVNQARLMRRLQACRGFEGEPQRLQVWQRSVMAQSLAQGSSQQRHDEVERVTFPDCKLTPVVNGNDMGMAHLLHPSRLIAKLIDIGSVPSQMVGQNLDGHHPLACEVAGAVHLGHTADRQQLLEPIRAKLLAYESAVLAAVHAPFQTWFPAGIVREGVGDDS